MARHIQEFRIFLASPGDVQVERKSVRSLAEEVNRTLGKNRGFVLRVVGWDTDATPGYGGDAQSLINTSIGQMADYDLFIGILWKRFGTETPRAGSGTEEEFNRAVEAHDTNGQPEIMLYAGQMPSNLTSRGDLEQKGKVLDFLDRVKPKGIYWAYNTPAEFAEEFRRHLELWLLRRLEEQAPSLPRTVSTQPEPPSEQSQPARPTSPAAAIPLVTAPVGTAALSVEQDWVLVGDGYFVAENVVERGNDTVVVELLPQDAEEDAALREMQRANQRGFHHTPLPFAYGNDGGVAKVESAESKSSGGKKVWTLTLKLQQISSSPLGEPVINGVTPDQAAELRAKLLLLNQPVKEAGNSGGMYDLTTKLIMGAMKEKQGIFPALWTKLGSKPVLFLKLARLWAIYILRTSNICEHVLELKLGLVDNNQSLDVTFRGTRAQVYSNRAPSKISVTGRCSLSEKSVA